MAVTINGTSGITDVDGSAGAPAITGTDTDTGLFFSTNILGLSTGGSERVRVDSSGNVGIGTSSPSSKLEVYDATSAVARVTAGTEIFEIRNTGSEVRLAVVSADPMTFRTSNVEAMRIDSSGNVGIGTTNIPSNKDTVTPKFVVNGSGVAGSMQIVRNTTVGGGGAILELTATRGSDVNSYTILQNGDGVGSVIFGGADGNEFVVAGSIQCQVDGTPGDNDMPGRLIFNTTADGASAPTERMRITSSGNVLIGSPTYTRRLSVKDTTNTVVVIEGSNSGSSNINFADSDSENPGSINYSHATNYMAFQTAGAERARIDSSGNVGIGTTSAYNSAKLSVNGDLEARGNIKSYYSSAGGISNGATQNIMTLPAGSYGSPLSGMLNIQQRNDNTGNLTMSTYLVSAWGGAGAIFTAVSTINYGSGSSFSITASTSGGDLTIYITNTSGATSTSINFSFMRLAGTAPTYAF